MEDTDRISVNDRVVIIEYEEACPMCGGTEFHIHCDWMGSTLEIYEMKCTCGFTFDEEEIENYITTKLEKN